MDLLIDQTILELFPELCIGVLLARGIDNSTTPPELERLKHDATARFRSAFDEEALAEHPNIRAWRETYRRFGVKPKEHRPTAEALLRRLLKGRELPSISAAVDSYLVVETEYLLPIGGYDLDAVAGAIRLTRSPGGEPFVPLGGGGDETTEEGEVVYRDDARVLTRRWNYRDADATKITEGSRNIALFAEAALPEIPLEDVEAAVDRMAEHIARFCGGRMSTHVLRAGEAARMGFTVE